MDRIWNIKQGKLNMQEKRNIDDLLTQVDLTPDSLQTEAPEPLDSYQDNKSGSQSDSNESTPEYESSEPDSSSASEEENTTDDYGQTASKKEKLYTQAEVEQMMRDRNKRGEFAKQEAEHKQVPTDENSEDWEQQFETLVEQTLTKREQKLQKQQWQERAQREQADFEIKFNSGAAKYVDFESVVVGKPLTPQMVIATKAMKDPAAFIYAAAKTQAHELDRISKIADPLVQAVEIGKLEERMRKGKSSTTAAPRPLDGVHGDVAHDKVRPRSVDDILREEAANKIRGRR